MSVFKGNQLRFKVNSNYVISRSGDLEAIALDIESEGDHFYKFEGLLAEVLLKISNEEILILEDIISNFPEFDNESCELLIDKVKSLGILK